MKATGVDITNFICRILKVKYLRYGIFHLIKVGRQKYTMYSCHGASNARLPYSKVKVVIDLSRHISAEIICMGHVHETYSHKFAYFAVDNGKRVQKDKYAVLTGHFLEYEGSYAEMMNLMPSKTGAVKISLFGDTHQIHTSQ